MQEKSIIENSILNVIKTISNIIFPLITFPYISRVLQPDSIGKINFGSSFVSYFSLIASLGITTYAIRECSAVREDNDKLSKIASQVFSINVCTTLVSYILLGFTLVLFRRLDAYRTIIIVQSTAIMFTTVGADWLNSAMEDFRFITIRSIAFQLISVLLMFIFVHKPEDYLIYTCITVISSCGANIVNIHYRKKFCNVRFVKKIGWKQHFKPIVLLFVMILAQTIFNSSDITMLGFMKGDYEVGIYSSAVKMSNLVSQIVASLAWVVMPRMSLYYSEGNFEVINSMLKKTFNVLVTIGLPCSVGCICLSKEIILIISGESFISAAPSLCILMIGFMFSLLGGSFLGNMVLLPSKREDVYMIICCIATFANLIMNYFLIPIGGVEAAASTTMFASFFIMVMLIIKRDRRVKLDYVLSTLVKPVIGCVFIVIVCSLVKIVFSNLLLSTILCIGFSIFIYFIVQIFLKNEVVLESLFTIWARIKKRFEK